MWEQMEWTNRNNCKKPKWWETTKQSLAAGAAGAWAPAGGCHTKVCRGGGTTLCSAKWGNLRAAAASSQVYSPSLSAAFMSPLQEDTIRKRAKILLSEEFFSFLSFPMIGGATNSGCTLTRNRSRNVYNTFVCIPSVYLLPAVMLSVALEITTFQQTLPCCAPSRALFPLPFRDRVTLEERNQVSSAGWTFMALFYYI